MARIRTLKPEFFRSRSLAKCDLAARLTFAGLWVEADDFGNGVADSRILKGAIWPLDDTIGWADVENHLTQLEATGHVLLYEVEGERYYHVVNWTEHQSAAFRRGSALYPVGPEQVVLHAAACTVQDSARERVLEQGTGNREQGGRTRAERRTPVPDGWVPNPNHQVFADQHHLDLAHEADQFRDHHEAKGSVMKDWDKAFWTWLRNAKKWGHVKSDEPSGTGSFVL